MHFPLKIRVFSGLLVALLLVSQIITNSPFASASSQIGPTAVLTVSPTGGSVFTVFEFDASQSLDGRGFKRNLEYRINFDWSFTPFTDWRTKNRFEYQYGTSGEKTIILEVKDKETGLFDQTVMHISLLENLAFDAELQVSPLQGNTNTPFRFEAEITSDLATPTSDYEVRFDFDGDNAWDTSFSQEHVAFYTFPRIGYYTPRVEVRHPTGSTIIITGFEEDNTALGEDREDMILVSLSGAPEASISVYPGVGVSGLTTFYVDASDSFDYEDFRVLEYRFDFQNDGVFDTTFSTIPEGQTKYESPGVYTILAQVRDSSGKTDESYTQVEVREQDSKPRADFTIRSDGKLADSTLGTTSTVFTFNGQSSKDNEDSSTKLRVRFDFENDGVFDTVFSSQKSVQHRFLEPGTYTVNMQVIDSAALIDSVSKEVRIIHNTEPEASLSITPLAGTPATVFSFDPRNSRDAQYDHSSLKVRYDFNSDGLYDTEFATLRVRRERFETVGKRTITAQIRDPEGKVSYASTSIEIFQNSSPQASLSVTPNDGTFNTSFVLDASTSFDPQPSSDELWYRFDYDYTGSGDIQFDTNFSKSSTRKIQFNRVNKVGTVQVRVQVKDEDGKISEAVSSVNLHWSSQFIEYFRRKGVLRGYQSGEMKPDQAITRAELTKVILETLDVSMSGRRFSGRFNDVQSRDWYWKYVEKAADLEIIQGYSDGSFRPNQNVSRAEALSIILRAFDIPSRSSQKIFSDVPRGQWFYDAVATAYEFGLIKGYDDGSFRPHNSITRGEAAKIAYLASQKFDF